MIAAALLLGWLPSLAEARSKKDDMLAVYPAIFKFCLFWWCVFVFVVMAMYIADTLLYRRKGPARINWSVEHTFSGAAPRQEYWDQFLDPSKWSTKTHPILQSADVKMVACSSQEAREAAERAIERDRRGQGEELDADGQPKEIPRTQVTDVPLGHLKPGQGIVLHHKDTGSDATAGQLFCTREVLTHEQPSDGIWRVAMQTVDFGVGYPFVPFTETSEIELHPPGSDGKVQCVMVGTASVTSRFLRWWAGLERDTRSAAISMIQAIGQELDSAKKRD